MGTHRATVTRRRLNPAQERQALALLDAAFDVPAQQLDAWFTAQGVDDTAVCQRVRELIKTEAEGATQDLDFLPGGGRSTWISSAAAGSARTAAPMPPAQVGPYQLQELIGSGGMGSVYRATRNDGLFEQTVAIKFVRPLRGLVHVEALVDAERRLLARMQHPAIAHILDGGTTDNGLHFLVLEYVDGVALDQHAQAHHLGTRARVAMLCAVCAAVTHAHQHLVLHCDIKPANILVTEAGQPKLIDFGVARIQDVIDAALPHGFTRAYTSPQRLAGEPAAVTDDVYSLGMVLAELLTGELPDVATGAFAGRLLDSELAAIARKALHTQRAARYTSVKAFEDDLHAWLDCRPLLAMGNDWRYRARKLVQRRPWRVAAGALGLGGLVTALVVISALYTRAESARQDAEQRFAQVRSLATYMLFDLDPQLETTPGNTQARRQMVGRSQQYLDTLASTAGGNLELQREVAVGLARLAEVQGVPGRAHVGEPAAAKANLDRADRLLTGLATHGTHSSQDWTWQRDLGRVRYLLALMAGARDNDAARELVLAREAEQHLQRALASAAASTVTDKDRAELEVLLTSARLTQADAHKTVDNHAAAATLQLGEETRLLALPAAVRAAMEFDYQSGRPAMLLGDSLYYLNRRGEALTAYRRAIARFSEGLQKTPLHRRLLEGTVIGYWSLSGTLDEAGQHGTALVEIERAIPLVKQLIALDPGNFEALRYHSMVHGQKAIVLANLRQFDRAIAITEEDLRLKKTRAEQAPDDAERWRDVAVPQRNLAAFYSDQGDRAGACRATRQAIAAWTAVERRWGLSELDRRNELEVLNKALPQRCG